MALRHVTCSICTPGTYFIQNMPLTAKLYASKLYVSGRRARS
jgi:hypothetical protein